MRYLIALAVMFALVGFAGFTHAADAPVKAKPHTHKGMFVKADATELTYKGAKAPNKEHQIKIDDKTKVTLDGKDAKITDLKVDNYLTITYVDELATEIEATTAAPVKKPK